MPPGSVELADFSGVDSRSSPLRLPPGKSLRCRNWIRKPSGILQLRHGFTRPGMSVVDTSSAIHSAYQFETYEDARTVLFSQGTALKQMEMGSTGTVTQIATLSNGDEWNAFFANNRMILGNGADAKKWDGDLLRNVGIRAPVANGGETTAFFDTSSSSYAGAAYEVDVGKEVWSSPSNATNSPNSSYATVTLGQYLGTSNYLRRIGYGLAIPLTNVILGIEFRVHGHIGAQDGQDAPSVYLRAMKSGAPVGLSAEQDLNSATDVTLTFGSPTYLWEESWSPSDVNDGNFGPSIYASRNNAFSPPTFYIDAIGVTVYHRGIGSGVTATVVASGGSFSATQLTGYQFYMAYYNPTTQHVGNRVAIGARKTISTDSSSVALTGLPDLSSIDPEWVKLIGRTPDSSDVPYVLVDANGGWIAVANTLTSYTLTLPDIDPNAELPTRNGLPPSFSKACWAQWRAYAIDDDDPHAIRYSESEFDSVGGRFVGRPEESWPANNKTFFPSGEACRAIHSLDDEAWVWTRNHVGILTEFGGVFTGDGRPVVRWRGTWPGGIASHRAFAKTPYGPFWLTADKQLMTRGANGPEVASGEYELTLLSQIGDAYLEDAELSYLRDPSKEIDRLYIKAKDSSGNPVVIVHDFKVGGGSDFVYTGITPNTFVRMPQQILSMRDADAKMRLWTGGTDGYFYQLEDGDSDNSATYSADLITILGFGADVPNIPAFEWHGDANVKVTITKDLRLTLAQIGALTSLPVKQLLDPNVALNRVEIGQPAQYMLVRLQLDSHHADGTLADNSPRGVPLETYGRVYLVRAEGGATRKGGRRP